ncbi:MULTISPECIES: hypothetical protein [Rhodomicrobium]|nr:MULTISPECIES: hypothetical protein [Rhodomicrobium]
MIEKSLIPYVQALRQGGYQASQAKALQANVFAADAVKPQGTGIAR